MSEEEKMLAGEIYDANYDKKLLEKRIYAKELCKKFNDCDIRDLEKKKVILEKLFQKYVLFSQNHHRFIQFLSQLPHRIFSEQTLKPAHDGRCFQVPPISVSPGGIFYFVNICRIQYSV